MKAKSLQKSRAETSAGSEFLSLLRISEFTQNFWVYSEFLSFFVLYSRILADFLSLLGKWVKLIKFEAENEFFCTWKVEKRQSTTSTLECSEKYKSFKLKIPQPDSERRHSPDFRTVFGIMIGPFSSCEIGKTWGTNKQVNKQTNKNWKFQFPQPDYRPRHSLDFRTVFGIMIGPFSSCKIGKTWGT